MMNKRLTLLALALGLALLLAILTLRLTEAQTEELTITQTEGGLLISLNSPPRIWTPTGPLSPTMYIDCAVSPSQASCVINVTVVDTRPLVLEVYTPFPPLATDKWRNDETGHWGLTLHFSRVPCDLGQPYARFLLKSLLKGKCIWDPVNRRHICPPQDTYARVSEERICEFLPSLSFSYVAPTYEPAPPTPPKTAPTLSPTPTKWRFIEATLTPTPAPEQTPTPRPTPGATPSGD